MKTLDFALLLSACRPGGAATLSSVTDLMAAEGPHGGIAPARFVSARGSNATYCYEQRFIDGAAAYCVLVDGKASQLNRLEDEVVKAIADGVEPLSLTPRVVVRYADGMAVSDLQLPHRLFDGHIRAGHVQGRSITGSSGNGVQVGAADPGLMGSCR